MKHERCHPSTVEDEELARRAQTGDVEAYRALAERFVRPSIALAWQVVRNRESAEDAVQDAFHRMVRSLATYDSARPFAPWFFAIVRNCALGAASSARRRQQIAPTFTFAELPESTVELGTILQDGGQRQAERMDLQRQIDLLPSMQRDCLRLCAFEGYTSREVGLMYSISEGTVRTHLQRARSSLRSAFDSALEPPTKPRPEGSRE